MRKIYKGVKNGLMKKIDLTVIWPSTFSVGFRQMSLHQKVYAEDEELNKAKTL